MWFSALNLLQSHLNFCTQGYGHVGCRSQVVAELQIGFQVCGFRFSIFCGVTEIFTDRVAGTRVSTLNFLQSYLNFCRQDYRHVGFGS